MPCQEVHCLPGLFSFLSIIQLFFSWQWMSRYINLLAAGSQLDFLKHFDLNGRSTTTMHHGGRPESFSRNHFPGYNSTRPEKATSEGREKKGGRNRLPLFPAAPPSSLTHSSLTEKGKVGLSLTLCYTYYRGAHVNRQEGRKSPTSHLELYVCRLLLSSQRLKGEKTAAVNIFAESRAKEWKTFPFVFPPVTSPPPPPPSLLCFFRRRCHEMERKKAKQRRRGVINCATHNSSKNRKGRKGRQPLIIFLFSL